jgi:hypothetical protein
MPLNTVIDHFSGGPAVVIMPPYETDAGGEIETYSIGDIPSTEIYMNELALSGSNSIAQ